ncbi:MAG: PLP-dependent lyase/thiolase [Candidatus Pacebacteria bacterium]|nr:PLP-dependent lyase/thiolase [Candidatus Paceibacterota bacterium]
MITPLESYPKLAAKIGVSALYFKREDLHPYGSHKGRSIPPMIDHYYAQGERRFAISSSGNAAFAAVLHISKLTDAFLDVFVGNHISDKKLDRLRNAISDPALAERIRILRKERPLQALIQATQDGMRSLRQSTDDIALKGYESLAEELIAESKKDAIGAVFIGTSSGTTAQALATYFSKKNVPIQVHIVQTSSCHPMAEVFEAYDGPDELSIADAIVDQIAQRKSALIPLIESTGGTGWIATNEDIDAALEFTREQTGLELSTNSALSVAGAMKAAYTGHEIDGALVCMICGD